MNMVHISIIRKLKKNHFTLICQKKKIILH